uniref:HERV-H LTR-associating 2b, tandem duplicate 1 n=1 Tax=Cyprinodon variegatus TaxID=28743 RepID=A0A3Q2CXT0_CYPVA
MSAIFTWACLLLLISSATQEKTPDVVVTCLNSQDCVLPCTFQPSRDETVEWFKQNTLLYRFNRNSSKESFELDQLAERASISPQQISDGNATLILRRGVPKDRGTYRCHVKTSGGEHRVKVILRVEAPIRGLFLERSRLSGYEEYKCSVDNVFPAPKVTWATEPPTFENLRPNTRMHIKPNGLYWVESRLRKLQGQPDLIYICKMTSSYSSSEWTTSLRQRDIHGTEGKDLTIRCMAPAYINFHSLYWTFTRENASTLILSYNMKTRNKVSPPSWEHHVELDIYKVSFGDGSLRLMDPKHQEHSGNYTCEFFVGQNKHIEHSQVNIGDASSSRQSEPEEPSNWWILGVVAGVVVIALAALVLFLKLRGRVQKPRNNPEEETELNKVKDGEAAP